MKASPPEGGASVAPSGVRGAVPGEGKGVPSQHPSSVHLRMCQGLVGMSGTKQDWSHPGNYGPLHLSCGTHTSHLYSSKRVQDVSPWHPPPSLEQRTDESEIRALPWCNVVLPGLHLARCGPGNTTGKKGNRRLLARAHLWEEV